MKPGTSDIPHRRADRPFPSSVVLVLGTHARLLDARAANSLGPEAAFAAMAPATKAAITADFKFFLGWCKSQRPVITSVPADPESLVHYLHWLAEGADTRRPAKPALPVR